MYKALDIRDNTEIVILDAQWLRAINKLREFGHQDFLLCQGCKQPVIVRAGEQRREHFAHKHLGSCDYADESKVLHDARVVLYEWLVSKFGDAVTIEKKMDGGNLFRPVDCWVKKDSTVFAYWIFDSQLKLEKRKILKEAFNKLGIPINWVFAFEEHPEQDDNNKLVLSTTEREFIKHSKYDMPASGYYGEGSLHYLDAENHKLTTFRCLNLYHKPQIYEGIRQISDLEKILVSPKTGEFVHAGELEKYQEYHQEGIYKPQQNWEGSSFHEDPDISFQPPDGEIPDNEIIEDGNREIKPARVINNPWFRDSKNPLNPDQSENKIGICVFCGKETDDWWAYNGKTGQCKCNSCKKLGRVEDGWPEKY